MEQKGQDGCVDGREEPDRGVGGRGGGRYVEAVSLAGGAQAAALSAPEPSRLRPRLLAPPWSWPLLRRCL